MAGSTGNGSSYAGRAEAHLDFDLEKLFGIKGSRFYIEGAWSSGQDISSQHIGNLFPAAQIFTGNGVRLSEMYFEQNLFDDKVSLAIGRLTTENDFLASTIYENYVNGGINGTPFGIPSGQPGFTTNPFTQWGFLAEYYPIEQLRTAIGVYNASDEVNANKQHGVDFSLDLDDGVMTVGEVEFLWNRKEEEGGLPGSAKVGFVYDNGRQPQLPDEETDKGNNYGFYAALEQMVYRESDDDPSQGLTPWGSSPMPRVKASTSTPSSSVPASSTRGRSRCATRMLPPSAFTMASCRAGSKAPVRRRYSNWPIRSRCATWFYVRPDFQYIFDPSGDAHISNAIVAGGEIGITF